MPQVAFYVWKVYQHGNKNTRQWKVVDWRVFLSSNVVVKISHKSINKVDHYRNKNTRQWKVVDWRVFLTSNVVVKM
jgi:hypothetical protein